MPTPQPGSQQPQPKHRGALSFLAFVEGNPPVENSCKTLFLFLFSSSRRWCPRSPALCCTSFHCRAATFSSPSAGASAFQSPATNSRSACANYNVCNSASSGCNRRDCNPYTTESGYIIWNRCNEGGWEICFSTVRETSLTVVFLLHISI